jgi:hypothetical protein
MEEFKKVSELHPFGCIAYAVMPINTVMPINNSNSKSKVNKCCSVGYSSEVKGGDVFFKTDVHFMDCVFPYVIGVPKRQLSAQQEADEE